MAGEVMLGISPGTRVMGISVLQNGSLVEWKVKTFKDAWSEKKQAFILEVISGISTYYQVTIVGIKKIDPFRSSEQLDSLVAAIALQAENMGQSVQFYSLSDLDYDKRNNNKHTKSNLSEHVVAKHPKLNWKYLQERNNRREYYTKMFEAIAVAEQCREM